MRRLSYCFFIVMLLALAGCRSTGYFGPTGLAATPPGELIRRAVPLNFVQLNADPAAYQDSFIQIQGAYMKLPVTACDPYRGPAFIWSLADLATDVVQRLRVDAQGFEEIIHLVAEGTPVTVEGFWRLYQGPLGCGKNAPREAIWYLEVIRIVAPNPFPGIMESPRVTPEGPQIEITPLVTLTPTPPALATPDPRLTPGITPETTVTPTASATPDPLLTPSASPTATVTPDPALTGTPALTPTAGLPPGEPTATPGGGGYPGPPPPTQPPGPGYP